MARHECEHLERAQQRIQQREGRFVVMILHHRASPDGIRFRTNSSSTAAWHRSACPGSGNGHQQARFFPCRPGNASKIICRFVYSICIAQSGKAPSGSSHSNQSWYIRTEPLRPCRSTGSGCRRWLSCRPSKCWPACANLCALELDALGFGAFHGPSYADGATLEMPEPVPDPVLWIGSAPQPDAGTGAHPGGHRDDYSSCLPRGPGETTRLIDVSDPAIYQQDTWQPPSRA